MSELDLYEGKFRKWNPTGEHVFVIMRYLKDPRFGEIERAIKRSLERHGFKAHLARDVNYAPTLWDNVRTIMHCCEYAVAVFEDIEVRDFNPNVSLETGYMLARDKTCLLLKEQRMPELPADLVGHLYESFDIFRIDETVSACIERWMVDLGIDRESRNLRRRISSIMAETGLPAKCVRKCTLLSLYESPDGLPFSHLLRKCAPRTRVTDRVYNQAFMDLEGAKLIRSKTPGDSRRSYILTARARSELSAYFELKGGAPADAD